MCHTVMSPIVTTGISINVLDSDPVHSVTIFWNILLAELLCCVPLLMMPRNIYYPPKPYTTPSSPLGSKYNIIEFSIRWHFDCCCLQCSWVTQFTLKASGGCESDETATTVERQVAAGWPQCLSGRWGAMWLSISSTELSLHCTKDKRPLTVNHSKAYCHIITDTKPATL